MTKGLKRKTPLKRGRSIKRKKKPAVASKPLRKKCDQARSRIVRSHGRCEMCGRTDCQLHDHHLIGRGALYHRYNFNNAMCLCAQCHTLSNACSAHGAPRSFSERLAAQSPEQSEWWDANRYELHIGHKTNYELILSALLEIETQVDAGRLRLVDLRQWGESDITRDTALSLLQEAPA